jgi:hypothetical protein
MKQKIIIVFIILVLIFGSAIIYLNNVILPQKIKSLIVKSLQEQTQKEVSLESLKFNIFKGLVLRGLNIYDNQKAIVSLKEVSCTFLLPPIFKKTIAIATIRIRSAEVLLERRIDNTFNLQDLIPKNLPQGQSAKFNIFVYKISITQAKVHFKDDTFTKPFTKDLEHLNLSLNMSLPAKVKFQLKSQIQSHPVIKITATGEYAIPEEELTAKISIQDFSPSEVANYYQDSGVVIAKGLLDAALDLRFKDNTLYANIWAKNRGMEISKDKNRVFVNSDIALNLEYGLKDKQMNRLEGNIKILNAELKLADSSIKDIFGTIDFNKESVKWQDLNFKYLDVPYKTKGTLTNFELPQIQLQLSSGDLFLDSDLTVNNKLIEVNKLSGKYLNSSFSLKGDVNAANAKNLETDISGELNIDLKDIKEPLKEFKNQLEKINPEGLINVQLSLSGNINDFKSCNVQAKLSSANISAYGLKAKEFSLTFNQSDGIADIPEIHLSLYDGAVDGEANMNLNSGNFPYWITADIQGLKLGKLKLDTPAKDKDIEGTLQAQVKLNGFSNDISKLSGAGQILITEGKLWQLNLFQGLGSLLFAKDDFSHIVFNEGSCGFIVQDKYIFTDSLKLKSNITDLSGTAKIGFDNSIDADINVEVLDDMAPLNGTIKDITTAIAGQGGVFGVIKISGTLKEPKYKFKPAVSNIIKGLKNIFFGE